MIVVLNFVNNQIMKNPAFSSTGVLLLKYKDRPAPARYLYTIQ
jgi:hypothetical protein